MLQMRSMLYAMDVEQAHIVNVQLLVRMLYIASVSSIDKSYVQDEKQRICLIPTRQCAASVSAPVAGQVIEL